MSASRRNQQCVAGTRSIKYAALTLGEARTRFCAEHGLPPDGGDDAGSWVIHFARLTIRLPNFAWRRRALLRHDLHHIVTGYACSPIGEMQMAAWEFAAGRFPNRMATAFCLPLVAMGAALAPKATFAAFLRGRAGATLYAEPVTDDLLAIDAAVLSSRLAPTASTPPTLADLAAYCWIVCQSFSLVFIPWLLLIAVGRAMR
jgi:hypothetical protein